MNEVESIVNSILPDVNRRENYFYLLLESINKADTYGSNKWGIYYEKDRIRFLVGSFIVFTISNGHIWVALDKRELEKNKSDFEELCKSKSWTWDTYDYPEYSKVASKNGFYKPLKNLETWDLIKKYHFIFIEEVTKRYEWLRIDSQAKHSTEFLNYLRDFLNCYIPEPNYNNPIKDIEYYNSSYKNLKETERETVVQSRIGQGIFRNNLINYWRGCAVTNCESISLLRASHIKPWRESNNEERLDKYNGLLLVPNLDSAFDNGLISFDNNGIIIISKKLNETDRIKLGIRQDMKMRKIDKDHIKYLKYHRENVYEE